MRSLTFFDYALEVWHMLNVCSQHIRFLPENVLDLLAKLLERIGMSHEETTALLVSLRLLSQGYLRFTKQKSSAMPYCLDLQGVR